MGRTQRGEARPVARMKCVPASTAACTASRGAFGDGFSVIEQGSVDVTRRAPAQSVSKLAVSAGRRLP